MDNFAYPINDAWTMEETILVVEYLAAVEKAYEKGIDAKDFEKHYKAFKSVVTSIAEEKRIDKAFQQASGYSLYKANQALKTQGQKLIRLG